MIRILIVDDSEMACDMLCALFSQGDDFEVVGCAHDGRQGVEMAKRLTPDLITMDLHMPTMTGYEAVERIMAHHPAAILVITSYREAETAFRCINLGALDVMDKPDLDSVNDADFVETFLSQARLLASTKVIRRPMSRALAAKSKPKATIAKVPKEMAKHLVAVASSTGGPLALSRLLAGLPMDFSAPILVVQHLAPGFEDGLVSWLGSVGPLDVSIAVSGEALLPAHVYMARPGVHLAVDDERRVVFPDEPPERGHRPSAKYLFESAARVFGVECTGVILTGMGSDGAKELGDIRAAGGLTIAQDEATSAIYGMPRAAVSLGSAKEVLALESIGPRLVEWVCG